MKTRKILLFVLALALISSLLVVIPSADSGKLSISEDYSTVTYNGEEYVRCPGLTYVSDSKTFYTESFKLTQEQEREISSVTAYVREGVYLRLNIYFAKGGYLNDFYVCVDYLDDYQSFVSKGGSDYYFFDYTNYQNVYISRGVIFNTPINLKSHELLYYDTFAPVTSVSADGYIKEESGYILYDGDGNYYYYDFSLSEGASLTVWQLDTEIFEDPFNTTDIFLEGGILLGFSAVIVSLFFGAIPLADLIICFVLSFKSKQPYRRGLRIVTLLCAAEIVAFVVTLIFLLSA